jgi:LVIVD repeat
MRTVQRNLVGRVTRKSHKLAILVASLATALVLLAFDQALAKAPTQQPFSGPVPRAVCGPGDRPETGLQGEVTLEDRTSGAVYDGFKCNLDLVGTFEGEGASFGFTWFKDCAYYGTGGGKGAPSPLQQHPGVVVLDASDPQNPIATEYLADPALLEPWESLRVNTKRKLLGGTRGLGLDPIADRFFAFYDISDCAHPVQLSVADVANHIGHEGRFTDDGLTYYGTRSVGVGVTAIDVSDPTNPKEILHTDEYIVHGLALNKDGTRAYFAQLGSPNSPTAPTANGLVIVDTSDIQSRAPNPQVRTVSTLFWNDGATAQVPLPVTIDGRPALIFTDEHGSGGSAANSNAGRQLACSLGLPPNGFPRIIDISDEKHPKTISKLMLEIDDPANCPIILNDPPAVISFSSHYCNVDRRNNPRLLACTFRESGLRVFDIRDVYHPREIAYYKPRARGTEVRPGSVFWGPQYANGANRTTDQTPTDVRFRRYRGDLQLWFTSEDNGFQIVKFSDHLKGTEGDLLSSDDDRTEDE